MRRLTLHSRPRELRNLASRPGKQLVSCGRNGKIGLDTNSHSGVLMSHRTAQILGWVTVAISLMVGLIGFAPFTPAIFLVPLLLAIAALVAWHGAVVAGLASFLLCIVAFAISPLPISQLLKWPLAVPWLGLCLVAVVLGTVHGIRISSKRRAK